MSGEHQARLTIPMVNYGTGVLFNGRYKETGQNWGNYECSQIQRSLKKTCMWPQTGAMVHLWAHDNDQSIQPRQRWSDIEHRYEKLAKCAKLVETHPRWIAANGASTKYWIKGLNTCINKIFQFKMFNLQKIRKLVFSVDWWAKIAISSIYKLNLQHNKVWKKWRGLNTFWRVWVVYLSMYLINRSETLG